MVFFREFRRKQGCGMRIHITLMRIQIQLSKIMRIHAAASLAESVEI
jgi:hypothetical protein